MKSSLSVEHTSYALLLFGDVISPARQAKSSLFLKHANHALFPIGDVISPAGQAKSSLFVEHAKPGQGISLSCLVRVLEAVKHCQIAIVKLDMQ